MQDMLQYKVQKSLFERKKASRKMPVRPINICMERMKGIEPSYQAWEARILPLNYIRML